MIRSIREATPVREFHVGRAVRLPQTAWGDVSAARVAELTSLMEGASAQEGRTQKGGETTSREGQPASAPRDPEGEANYG